MLLSQQCAQVAKKAKKASISNSAASQEQGGLCFTQQLSSVFSFGPFTRKALSCWSMSRKGQQSCAGCGAQRDGGG